MISLRKTSTTLENHWATLFFWSGLALCRSSHASLTIQQETCPVETRKAMVFIVPLVNAMVHPEPSLRPSINDVIISFEKECHSISRHMLDSSLRPETRKRSSLSSLFGIKSSKSPPPQGSHRRGNSTTNLPTAHWNNISDHHELDMRPSSVEPSAHPSSLHQTNTDQLARTQSSDRETPLVPTKSSRHRHRSSSHAKPAPVDKPLPEIAASDLPRSRASSMTGPDLSTPLQISAPRSQSRAKDSRRENRPSRESRRRHSQEPMVQLDRSTPLVSIMDGELGSSPSSKHRRRDRDKASDTDHDRDKERGREERPHRHRHRHSTDYSSKRESRRSKSRHQQSASLRMEMI